MTLQEIHHLALLLAAPGPSRDSDSVLDILTSWTEAELESLDSGDAATVADYVAARRAAWDRGLSCPDDVPDHAWEDACACQDLGAMPHATEILRRGVAP